MKGEDLGGPSLVTSGYIELTFYDYLFTLALV